MDIYEKINSGYYKNQFSFPKSTGWYIKCPKCSSNVHKESKFCSECSTNIKDHVQKLKDEYDAQRDLYDKRDKELKKEFKQDALDFVGYGDHPRKDLIYNRAWDEGHSGGFGEILCALIDLCEFLDSIFSELDA